VSATAAGADGGARNGPQPGKLVRFTRPTADELNRVAGLDPLAGEEDEEVRPRGIHTVFRTGVRSSGAAPPPTRGSRSRRIREGRDPVSCAREASSGGRAVSESRLHAVAIRAVVSNKGADRRRTWDGTVATVTTGSRDNGAATSAIRIESPTSCPCRGWGRTKGEIVRNRPPPSRRPRRCSSPHCLPPAGGGRRAQADHPSLTKGLSVRKETLRFSRLVLVNRFRGQKSKGPSAATRGKGREISSRYPCRWRKRWEISDCGHQKRGEAGPAKRIRLPPDCREGLPRKDPSDLEGLLQRPPRGALALLKDTKNGTRFRTRL